jgi:hypothetical protein
MIGQTTTGKRSGQPRYFLQEVLSVALIGKGSNGVMA